MKPFAIAIIAVILMGVGVYIGTSGLVTQYAVIPGRSSAGTAVCSPASDVAVRGATVQFTASNLPANALYHWSSDEGRSMNGGTTFSVQFTTPGTKTVSLFYFDRTAWVRTTCQVLVR